MKRLISLCLYLLLALSAVSGMALPLSVSAVDNAAGTAIPNSYVPGLVAWYDGTQNTRAGEDTSSTVWEDLISGYDLPVTVNDKNYFTEEGFLLESQKNYFPDAIKELVNGEQFTVEIRFGTFISIGKDYNTFMNSDNDNFALFRRNSDNTIEFKFAANTASGRPKVADGLNKLQDALITITYRVGGDCTVYINGVEAAVKECNSAMGANNLFIGHVDNKAYQALYRSIRFYDRELSAVEVAHNAAVDGYIDVRSLYVTDGLVSLYSGIRNTAEGFDPDATVWEDLVSGYHVPVTINANNYFTREGLHLDTAKNYFGQEILNLVNGQEFTVEMYLGDLISKGSDYDTFINSTNDAFSLFRRKSNDVLELKFASNAPGERPTVTDGLNTFDNSLITVTYKVGGKVVVYVDGVQAGEASAPRAMGAGDLFFGHDSSTRNYETTFRSLRFYNRALTAEEVRANAMADGAYDVSAPVVSNPGYVTVSQPRTNISGDIALVRPVDSAEELAAVVAGETKPAAVILSVNSKLEITDQAGKAFSTVEQVLDTLGYVILPVFDLADTATADALVEYLKGIRFSDCFFMSDDPDLVLYAREALPAVRGIIDYTETYKDSTGLTTEECVELRRSLKSHMGTIALLPAAAARQSAVQYLYDSIVNVWVRTSDTPSTVEQFDALLSGALGVVSDDTDGLLAAAGTLAEGTMTRVPLNIGHRGLPSSNPENTVEGSLAAYAAGADVIEIDIYLTTDNEIVIMHDATTGRTCDRNLTVESSTLAQLKELYVNRGFENNADKNTWRIPTLQEYLEAFKDKDCRLFIEIKSSKEAIVPIMKELIEAYDMYDQCAVITFIDSQMANMKKYYPEMSVGALCGGYLDETDSDMDMRAVMAFIGKYNATLNPSYGGYGENAIRASLIRGIGIYPWTFDGSSYYNYFTWGYSGLTGNTATSLSRMPKTFQVTSVADGDAVAVGDTLVLSATSMNYKRTDSDVSSSAVYTILAGEDLVTLENGVMTFTGEGDVTFIASYANERLMKYTLYTQPITIHVSAAETEPETTVPDTEPVTEPPVVTESDTVPETTPAPEDSTPGDTTPEETTGTSGGGCQSALGGAALLLVALGGGVLAVKRRKH